MNDVVNLIAMNRPAVLAIFRKYKIDSQPTAENVIYAYIVHKEPFLVDLYREIYGEYNFADGKGGDEAKKVRDGSGWANFKNIFGDSVSMLGDLANTGVGVWGNYNSAKDGNPTSSPTQQGGQPQTFLPQQPKTDNKQMLYIGGGVAAIILLIVLLK